MTSLAIEAEHLVKKFGDQTGRRRRQLLRARGVGPGAARPQRRRQDDDGADDDHPGRARRAARRGWPATTSCASPTRCGRSMGLTGQAATVDELLTGRENLRAHRVALRPVRSYTKAGGRRPARAVLADRRRRPHRQDLLRRHAAPARPRGEPHRDPARALPRRADHRPRPAQPGRAVGGAARPGQGRHHAAARPPSTSRRPTSSPTASSSSTAAGSSPRARRCELKDRVARPASSSPCRAPTDLPTAERHAARARRREVHVDEAARQLTAPGRGPARHDPHRRGLRGQRRSSSTTSGSSGRASTTCSST